MKEERDKIRSVHANFDQRTIYPDFDKIMNDKNFQLKQKYYDELRTSTADSPKINAPPSSPRKTSPISKADVIIKDDKKVPENSKSIENIENLVKDDNQKRFSNVIKGLKK